MISLLKFDEANRLIVIDNLGLLLVSEFDKLSDKNRNSSKEDPTGSYKDRLFRELTYIYLMIDWRSPYADYAEQERHNAAREDSRLSEEEWQDLDFRAACRKYKELQESNLEWRLLQAAREMVEKFVRYFQSIDPVTDIDPVTGKPIYKVKDVMAEISSLSKVTDELKTLEYQYKKQAEAPKANRAGIEEGFDPRKVRKNG